MNYISLYTNKYGETRRNRQAEKKQTHIAQAQAKQNQNQKQKQKHTNRDIMADPDCDFCGDLGCVYCDSDDGGNDYDLTQYNDDDCGACDGVGCQYCDN